jgi:hypothetical protein
VAVNEEGFESVEIEFGGWELIKRIYFFLLNWFFFLGSCFGWGCFLFFLRRE